MALKTFTPQELKDNEQTILSDPSYSYHIKLLERWLKRFPNNTVLDEIASKVVLIDFTNSTWLTRQPLTLEEIANHIRNIRGIDSRLKSGDPSLVNDIANIKGRNLFSFASKYCCYHNRYVYGRDDYSIYDRIIAFHLHEYFDYVDPNTKTKRLEAKKTTSTVKKRRDNLDYESFNRCIADNLNYLYPSGWPSNVSRKSLDSYIWYLNK